MDQRFEELQAWLNMSLPNPLTKIVALAGDASFRRYFRIESEHQQFIVMDSPPQLEDCRPFISVAQRFASHHITVPVIHAADAERGYLLLSDLGQQQYLSALNPSSADKLYKIAFDTLLQIYHVTQDNGYHFPVYDHADFMRELTNFQHWFLDIHLQLKLTHNEQQLLNHSFEFLIDNALNQPQLCIHRDYHSRNLMVLPNDKIGVLDFQDAVWGPITYDLASLLRDCYVSWPRSQIEAWVNYHYHQIQETALLTNVSYPQYLRWFDLAGLQRHLKCMFIFARKYHRDGTRAFLGDIPRIVNYSLDVSQRYPELKPLFSFLADTVLERLARSNSE